MSGLAVMLGTDIWRIKHLVAQNRLPEPVQVVRGKAIHKFFNLDLVRGKMGAQSSLTKQGKPAFPKPKAVYSMERAIRLSKG
jgi:hypothetical protein